MKIKEMSTLERPYEKCEKYGIKTLTNAELLAIILKSGTKNKSSIEIANEILKLKNSKIRDIFFDDFKEISEIKGVGKVKLITLEAISEIIKRVEKPIIKTDFKVKNTDEVAKVYIPEMRYSKIEILKVLVLDTKNYIKDEIDFTTNNSNMISISKEEIIKYAIKKDASRIILIHNHPSGDCMPSSGDINYTRDIKKELDKFKIKLLDHIVIGDGNFETIMKYI